MGNILRNNIDSSTLYQVLLYSSLQWSYQVIISRDKNYNIVISKNNIYHSNINDTVWKIY